MRDPALHRLPIEGAADSRVRVIAYEDLQCRDAAAWRRMLDETLLPRYGDRVAFESRDFPLPHHNWAELAALACRHLAVIDPRAAIDLRRYCYERIDDISPENLPERLAEFAEAHDLDPEDTILALESDDARHAVALDLKEGRQRGVVKTPTVFVGHKRFVETFDVDAVARAIEAASFGETGAR